jgi:hypothetical protein
VLGWIRHGMSRRAIADRLGISGNAVKDHVANLSTKLVVSGIRELRHRPGCPAASTPAARRDTMTGPAPLGAIGQVSLLTRDVARAERFYTLALMSRVPIAPA